MPGVRVGHDRAMRTTLLIAPLWTATTLGAAQEPTAPELPAQGPARAEGEESQETWSQLQLYLGIDPDTGEFKQPEDRGAAQERPDGSQDTEPLDQPTAEVSDTPEAVARAVEARRNPLRDLIDDPDRVPAGGEDASRAVAAALRDLDP